MKDIESYYVQYRENYNRILVDHLGNVSSPFMLTGILYPLHSNLIVLDHIIWQPGLATWSLESGRLLFPVRPKIHQLEHMPLWKKIVVSVMDAPKGLSTKFGIYIYIYLSIYLSLWFWCMFIHLFIHGLRVYLAFLCPWKIERKGPPIVVETKSIVGYLTMGNTCISIYTLLGKLFGNFWETSLVPFPNFS